MVGNILAKVFGSKHERDAKRIRPIEEEINGFFEKYDSLSDEELKSKTEEFKQRIKDRTAELQKQLDDLREEFAQIKTHGLSEEERADVRSQKESLLQQTKEIRDEMKKVEREVLDDAADTGANLERRELPAAERSDLA